MTKADKDGWIEWGGGEMPVPGDTLVNVRYRDGDFSNGEYPAYGWTWKHFYEPGDVVAYRIITPALSYEGASVQTGQKNEGTCLAPSPYATIMRGFAAQHSCALACITVNELRDEF